MTDLEAVIAALDETLTFYEPDDNVARFGEQLRRNLQALTPVSGRTEELPY